MPFFPGVQCALDLTPLQVALLEYISLYESVDNMDPRDKPEQQVIDNDEKFDEWAREFTARREAEIKSGSESKGADRHQRVTRFDADAVIDEPEEI